MSATQGSERALVETVRQALHARFRFPFDPLVSEAMGAADALEAHLVVLEEALRQIDYGIEVDWSKGVDENCERLREIARAALAHPDREEADA